MVPDDLQKALANEIHLHKLLQKLTLFEMRGDLLNESDLSNVVADSVNDCRGSIADPIIKMKGSVFDAAKELINANKQKMRIKEEQTAVAVKIENLFKDQERLRMNIASLEKFEKIDHSVKLLNRYMDDLNKLKILCLI